MKKVLSLLLAVFLLGAFAPAALAEAPVLSGVSVHLSTVMGAGSPKAQDLTFDLLDADSGVVIDAKVLTLDENSGSYHRLDFSTPEYEAGKKFALHLAAGDAVLSFNGQTGAYFLLETYCWPDASGNTSCVNEFFMELRPAAERTTRLYLAGQSRPDVPLFTFPEGILIPAAALDAVGIRTEKIDGGALRMTSGARSMVLLPDQLCAYTSEKAMNLTLAPRTIDGVDYVPVSDVTGYFSRPVSYSDDGVTLKLLIGAANAPYMTEDPEIGEARVSPVSSDTDYLIWISKSEYMVRVYHGSAGGWKLLKSFQCAIGKPSTPTVTGTFKYYAKQARWSYASYWCGPIMLFRSGGYAIHSTLRRYNGSDYDGRVGAAISHGCVRVRPENIDWLFNTIPLNTTVYITA